MCRDIIFQKVTQNNLKNITFKIEKNKITTVTGPSGSGKSSLAFETVYAEGQRRFWESLPAFSKFFSNHFNKPLFEVAENIPPTIAVEQTNRIKTSRGTVATQTEIYDLLVQLFVIDGYHECECGGRVKKRTIENVISEIKENFQNQEILILFKKRDELSYEDLLRASFVRGIKANKLVRIEDLKDKSSINIVVDRFNTEKVSLSRFREAIESAFLWGGDEIFVKADGLFKYKIGLSCGKCGGKYSLLQASDLSFNNSRGACSNCKGFGNIIDYDFDLIVPDKNKSIEGGAIYPFEKPSYLKWKREVMSFCKKESIDTKKGWNKLCNDDVKKIQKRIIYNFKKIEKKYYKVQVRVFVSRFKSEFLCPVCLGARLNKLALNYKINNKNIFDYLSLNSDKLLEEIVALKKKSLKGIKVIDRIKNVLCYLIRLGLGYIDFSRALKTLSGGELQRVRLAGYLSHGMTGTLYVLDEPTTGLHARDVFELSLVLRNLCLLGNTVLVVEQDEKIIHESDNIIELGPKSGIYGGHITFSGKTKEYISLKNKIRKQESKKSIQKIQPLNEKNSLIFKAIKHRNFKNITVEIPLNKFVCVTGVSGSGKSTLVKEIVYPTLARVLYSEPCKVGKFGSVLGIKNIKEVVLIDQKMPNKRARSLLATYLKFFDEIRKSFSSLEISKKRKIMPGAFSLNVSGGRCEVCKGLGKVLIDLSFMGEIEVECSSCNGKRYEKHILNIRDRGKNIQDVLNMTVEEAIDFYNDRKILVKKLDIIKNIGLGYLPIGISLDKLSGGELQRVKMLKELQEKKKPTLYIFDEPSLGLGFFEIDILLKIFRDLIAKKHSVICVEHELAVINSSDYVIDLGPQGGEKGGEVVYSGPTERLIESKDSYTGDYLKKWIQTHNAPSVS
jgi:excinuclease ABC subunit A